MPYLRLFGQEFSPIKDKHQILCRYQNHLSLENASHPYYWTEKLADGLIMRNRVFQGGDSEAKRYFPGRGVIFINHWDLNKTYKKLTRNLKTLATLRSARFWFQIAGQYSKTEIFFHFFNAT